MTEIRVAEEKIDMEAIARQYGGGIIKYCYAHLCDYHDAQDAAQTAFLIALKNADGIHDTQKIKPWLYRVAHNTCMDMLRRKSRFKLFAAKEAPQSEVHTDNYNLGISEQLQAALDSLSPKDRALVYSRAVDEMEYEQLAEIYGAKPAALRKRYERARKKLEQELKM